MLIVIDIYTQGEPHGPQESESKSKKDSSTGTGV